MIVNILYNNGKVCTVQADPAGSADGDLTCATKGVVELVDGVLVFVATVLSRVSGKWSNPKYVINRETFTCSGHPVSGKYVDDGCTSWTVEKTGDCVRKYVLMTEAELEGAASVTVDGVLVYASEDGRLVSVMGDGGAAAQGCPEIEKLRGGDTSKATSSTAKPYADTFSVGQSSPKGAGMSK